MAEDKGRDRFMGVGGGIVRPSPAAAAPAPAPVTSATTGAGTLNPGQEKTPAHVVERMVAIQAEVAASVQESKTLHESLSRRGQPEAEAARIIAARLATIEGHVRALSA